MKEMELLNYVDITLGLGEHVEFEFIENTPIGAIVKVYVNDDIMGELELTQAELLNYTDGIWGR